MSTELWRMITLSAAQAFTDSAQYGIGLHLCKDALHANVHRVDH